MKPVFIYALGLVALIVGSYLAAGAGFGIYDRVAGSTSRAWWWGYLLNFAGPFCAGIPISALLANLLELRGEFRATLRGHLQRATSWYVFAASVLVVMTLNRGNSDFGLWSQAIIWPLVSTVGAVATDLAWTWRRSAMARTA